MAANTREFSIIVFGSTGFTGERVVQCLAEGSPISLPDGNWAVAGRNETKVRAHLDELAKHVEGFDPSKVPVIVADAGDAESLRAMAKRCKVLLNATGPYRFLGLQVARACAETGTHCVDISGEPHFLELCEHLLHDLASSNGASIVGSCGFDSIPADIGAEMIRKWFKERGMVCSHIESFLCARAGPHGLRGHATTFECAVHGFAHAKELTALRKQVGAARPKTVGERLPRRGALFWDNRVDPDFGDSLEHVVRGGSPGRWAMPFPGADASVVRRTQRKIEAAGEGPPVQYGAYFTVRSAFWVALVGIAGTVMKALAGFSWGRSMMIKWPGLFTFGMFSHDGPSREQIETSRFDMRFFGKGYSDPNAATQGGKPDVEVEGTCNGPEPGYAATPILMLASAAMILDEGDQVPTGVSTPGFAFRNTSLISMLAKSGVRFECKAKDGVDGKNQKKND